MNTVVLAFFSPGPMEMVIIGVIAVLLFGKRLPEVGRSLGRSLVEFKKGISGIENEIHSAVHSSPTSSSGSRRAMETEDREEATAPKFEPPAATSEEGNHPSNQPTTETADNAESISGA
jgi:sec-independent protein translocase protein TatA